MMVDDGLNDAEGDENNAACQETDNQHFVLVPALEAEEGNLSIEQPATYERQTD